METHSVPAEIRTVRGKGASRRLRKSGLVPGILYGADRDPVALEIPQRYLLRALEDESFFTSILEIKVGDGRSQRVILRDLQRHPFKQQIMHADFLRISETEKMTIRLALHFANEDTSPAGKMSGVVISHQVTDVEVSCLPKDLPEHLEIDLADLDVGDIMHLSDIPLPEGVEIPALAQGEDATIVSAQHVAAAEEVEEAVSAEVPVVGEAEAAPAADEAADGGDDEADG
ncbi:MAG: 50S ribosomal protein L25/general stress protein Ctc [Xanthomonadales bacterium]|nr:50S ribosomal protein L25/general stress protein Ctc [Xanthomonadales bacterium]